MLKMGKMEGCDIVEGGDVGRERRDCKRLRKGGLYARRDFFLLGLRKVCIFAAEITAQGVACLSPYSLFSPFLPCAIEVP